jgi:RecG-like helicase
VVERIHGACREGRQAYWVCPLIEESEELRAQAAEETAAQLAEALPGVRVGLVHGRMPPREEGTGDARFKDGKTQLLVATTVIEVGVDVPNASLMVIENAERMGLAQLHQLRGRVGRGSQEQLRAAVPPPLSAAGPRAAGHARQQRRLRDRAADLELRGPGELLGTRQTGLADLRVADLIRDADLLAPGLGVQSTAIAFGDMDTLLVGVMQAMVLGALVLAGRLVGMHWPFYVALAAAALLFAWQQWIVRDRDREACFRAFVNNHWVGLVIMAGVALG